MKSIRLILFPLILLIQFSFLPGKGNQSIAIPFVTQSKGVENKILNKKSLILLVNGKERPIESVRWIDRSLSGMSIHGREFLLSFFSDRVCKGLRDAISYFISDIVNHNDSLSILTPLKAYRIRVGRNKLKIIENITKIVAKDCEIFSNLKASCEEELRQKIKCIEKVIKSSKNFFNRAKNSAALFQFFHSFPAEYKRYQELITILNPVKFEKAVSILKHPQTEKWWIHFSRGDLSGITGEIRRLIERIDSISNFSPIVKCSDVSQPRLKLEISAKNFRSEQSEPCVNEAVYFLKRLRKISGHHEICKRPDLQTKLLLSKICFNSIIFESENGSAIERVVRERSVSAGLLKQISTFSGGVSIQAIEPEKKLKSISARNLGFYTLSFPVSRNDQSLHIKIIDNSGAENDYLYPQRINDKQLKSIVRNSSRSTCRIKDLKIYKNTVSFRIDRFCRAASGDFGLLRISLCVNTKTGNIVYNREKTLRSEKGREKISLSVKIPADLKGEHNINLSVIDLIAKSSSSLQKDIRFK